MHKGIIALVKARSAEQAKELVANYIEPYGDGDVWDWYEVGGRWNGTLGKSNVLPLKDCINIVKKWRKDMEKESEAAFKLMLKERRKEKTPKFKSSTMSGYYAGRYRDLKYRTFSFESNVFNIEEDESENVPKDVKGYWAVLLDLHN